MRPFISTQNLAINYVHYKESKDKFEDENIIVQPICLKGNFLINFLKYFVMIVIP